MLTGTKNPDFASNEDKAQSDAKVTQCSCCKKSLWEYLGRTEEGTMSSRKPMECSGSALVTAKY